MVPSYDTLFYMVFPPKRYRVLKDKYPSLTDVEKVVSVSMSRPEGSQDEVVNLLWSIVLS